MCHNLGHQTTLQKNLDITSCVTTLVTRLRYRKTWILHHVSQPWSPDYATGKPGYYIMCHNLGHQTTLQKNLDITSCVTTLVTRLRYRKTWILHHVSQPWSPDYATEKPGYYIMCPNLGHLTTLQKNLDITSCVPTLVTRLRYRKTWILHHVSQPWSPDYATEKPGYYIMCHNLGHQTTLQKNLDITSCVTTLVTRLRYRKTWILHHVSQPWSPDYATGKPGYYIMCHNLGHQTTLQKNLDITSCVPTLVTRLRYRKTWILHHVSQPWSPDYGTEKPGYYIMCPNLGHQTTVQKNLDITSCVPTLVT
ncbi:hypothetical protein BgiBS90_000101 [Biomphalaria glabrata]|nr:hypothetical protein BgiBS90_000101 [Biomphalaria glabrata]